MFHGPVHPVRSNPTKQIEDDLDLIVHLDRLGFDEAWIGEHHCGGSEIIGAPEVLIAAAAERTKWIRLGTGVNSLPYHHPLILADRWMLLSHLTHGRAMFGVGPGALPWDSWQLGIDPLQSREMMEASLEAIVALIEGETPVNMDTKWFTLRDARLHLAPFRDEVDLRVAAAFSPAGPRAAGRFGLGMLSVGATTPAGLDAAREAWGIVEERAAQFGRTADRDRWAVVAPVHLAETVEAARREVEWGLGTWMEYFKSISPMPLTSDPHDTPAIIKELTETFGFAVIGTPEMAVERIPAADGADRRVRRVPRADG